MDYLMLLLKLFYQFFKIGLFTFGGGYAMIPLVEETVAANNWLAGESFTDLIGICESTPGPIAINMATYIGSTQGNAMYGIPGAIGGAFVATLGVVLPSFIIILIIAAILSNFMKYKVIQKILVGIKAVVIGLIIGTGLKLMADLIFYNKEMHNFKFDDISIISLIILAVITLLFFISKYVFKKKMNAVLIIAISSILGIIVCSLFQLSF